MYRSPKISPCLKCQNHGKIVVSHCPYFSCQCKSCKQTDILADLKHQHQQIIRSLEPVCQEKGPVEGKQKIVQGSMGELTSGKALKDSREIINSEKTFKDSKDKLTSGQTFGLKLDSKEKMKIGKTFLDSKEKLTSEKTFGQSLDCKKKLKTGKTLHNSKEKLTSGKTFGQKSLQDSKEEPTNVKSFGRKSVQAHTKKVAIKRKRETEISQSSEEKPFSRSRAKHNALGLMDSKEEPTIVKSFGRKYLQTLREKVAIKRKRECEASQSAEENLASRSKGKHNALDFTDHNEKVAIKVKIEDVRPVDLVNYKKGVLVGESENCLDKEIKREIGDWKEVKNKNYFAQDIKVDIGSDEDKNENCLVKDIQGEYSKYFKMESGECEVDKNDNSVAQFLEGQNCKKVDGEFKYENYLVRDIQQYLTKERRLCNLDKEEDYPAEDVKGNNFRKESGQCGIDFVKPQSQENFIIKSEYIENEEIKIEPANDELKIEKYDTALESIDYCYNFFEKESSVEPIIEVSDKASHQRINDHEQSMDLFLEAIKMLNNVIKPS